MRAWDVGGSFLVAGNCSSPTPAVQGWEYAAGHLMHGGLCVDSSVDQSELQVATCDARSPNRELRRVLSFTVVYVMVDVAN